MLPEEGSIDLVSFTLAGPLWRPHLFYLTF